MSAVIAMFTDGSKSLALVAAALCLTAAGDAQAYLDPGTGSVIFQAVAAAIAGTALVMRMYWRKIKALFSGSKAPADTTRAQPGKPDADANDARDGS